MNAAVMIVTPRMSPAASGWRAMDSVAVDAMRPIPIPAPLFAVGYLAFSWYSSRTNRGQINHDAHIFGALTGLAFVLLTDSRTFMNVLESLL